mgnify:CR=1 FL=1
MRILVVNWRDIHHPEAGGAEVHFHETFTRIAKAGHHVTLLCSRYPGAEVHESIDGITVIRNGWKLTFNLTVPWFYHRHLAHEAFDIIIEDLNKIPFFLPCFTKRPVLALLHHLFGTAVFRETNPIFAAYVYLTERLIPAVYRRCFFEVVSESSRDELIRMGLSSDQITVIHNGIDTRLYEHIDVLDQKEAALIVYMGRLKRYKNVDHLIQAMTMVRESVPDARLCIIGTGDQRKALEAMCRSMHLTDAVKFTGFISDQDKVGILRQATVAAFPSDKEGWGLTVIEANACYTPVVATDVPGLRDAVVHGETGVLIPLGDREAMARALISLIQDRQERERLARNAANRALQFTWDTTAEKTLEVIEKVVKEHR